MNSLRKILVLQLLCFMILLAADVVMNINAVSSQNEIAQVITALENPNL